MACLFNFLPFLFSCIGLLCLGITSAGNGSNSTRVWPLLIAIVSLAFLTFYPFITFALDRFNFNVRDEQGIVTYVNSNIYNVVGYVSSLVLGCAALLCQFSILYKIITNALALPSINRKAIGHKVELMVENALHIHRSNELKEKDGNENKGVAKSILTFMKTSDSAKTEHCGGFIWCLKKIWNKDLFFTEGITIPTRVLIGNFSLIFVTIFIIAFGRYFVRNADTNFRTYHEQAVVNKIVQFIENIGSTVIRTSINAVQKFIEDLPSLLLPSNHTCPAADQIAACVQNIDFTNCTDSETMILCSIKDLNISSVIDPDKVAQEMKNFVSKIAKSVANASFDYLYPSKKRMLV